MDRFAIRTQSVSQATAYRFVFEREGWAIFTINDETGEFTLHSDWGTYGYRWHPPHLPAPSLTAFLAQKGKHQYDCDYIVEKFQLATCSKELDDVIDEERSTRAVRELILQRRRRGSIEASEARSMWERAEEWANDSPDHNWPDSDLAELMDSEPHAYIRRSPSGRHLVLRDQLLPFFCRWLRENVVEKAAAPVEQAVAP